MLTWIIIIVVVIVIAIALVAVGSRLPEQNQDPLEARLAEFTQRGEQVSLEELELSQPFAERVIYPALKTFGEIASRFTPQNAIQQTTLKLELAGNPGRIDAATLLASRFFAAFGIAVVAYLMFTFTILKQPTSKALLFSLVGAVLGFLLPQALLDTRIKRRQKEVQKAMPDALDLLTICVEAGLGFEAAMSKVAEKWDNEVSLAFGRCIRELQLGKARREALRDMADRIGLPEMTSFVAAVIQGQELGVSMAKVLRIQSDQMRMKRRQRAEEEARQAPIKMLLPMVAFIFPSIFIVLMYPAARRIMNSSLGG
jgi:tight adherence protein C